MKTLAFVAMMAATPAFAEAPFVAGTLEYQMEADAVELEMGVVIPASPTLTISPSATVVAKNGDFDLDGLDVTADLSLNENTSVYARVEFDADLEYDEFAAGVAFKF